MDTGDGCRVVGVLQARSKTSIHGGTDGAYDCLSGRPLPQVKKESESK